MVQLRKGVEQTAGPSAWGPGARGVPHPAPACLCCCCCSLCLPPACAGLLPRWPAARTRPLTRRARPAAVPCPAVSTMWASAATSLISAYGVAWVGSWFGTDAYRLLHDTPNWVAVAPTWLAWTVPYVAGTLVHGKPRAAGARFHGRAAHACRCPALPLTAPAPCLVPCAQAAYALNPLSVTKVAIRPIANEQMQLYRDVPLASCVSVAAIVAFCQCLTWQVGGWARVGSRAGAARAPSTGAHARPAAAAAAIHARRACGRTPSQATWAAAATRSCSPTLARWPTACGPAWARWWARPCCPPSW